MDNYGSGLASCLREAVSRTKGDHLVGTCNNLNDGATILLSLPLQLFEERRVIVPPVSKSVGDPRLGQSVEEDGRCRIHFVLLSMSVICEVICQWTVRCGRSSGTLG